QVLVKSRAKSNFRLARACGVVLSRAIGRDLDQSLAHSYADRAELLAHSIRRAQFEMRENLHSGLGPGGGRKVKVEILPPEEQVANCSTDQKELPSALLKNGSELNGERVQALGRDVFGCFIHDESTCKTSAARRQCFRYNRRHLHNAGEVQG